MGKLIVNGNVQLRYEIAGGHVVWVSTAQNVATRCPLIIRRLVTCMNWFNIPGSQARFKTTWYPGALYPPYLYLNLFILPMHIYIYIYIYIYKNTYI